MDTKKLASVMKDYAPIEWDRIPDIGLYKDQVVSFVSQVYAPLYGEKARTLLTPAMINNYVKSGALDRPTGKKYGREQLATLIMLAILKQCMPIETADRLIRQKSDLRATYADFCSFLVSILHSFADSMLTDGSDSALLTALGASVCSFAGEMLLSENA